MWKGTQVGKGYHQERRR